VSGGLGQTEQTGQTELTELTELISANAKERSSPSAG
jgi:hypothetical protein